LSRAIVVPLIRGLGFFEDGFVFIEEYLVHEVIALIAHHRAQGGEEGGEDGYPLVEAVTGTVAMVSGVEGFFVGGVGVEAVLAHAMVL
jgi:hypothetical protein